MKFVYETANDFVLREVEEWGWDYVDEKFASGYEPTLVNGVWCWHTPNLAVGSRSANVITSVKPRNSLTLVIR